MVLFSWVLPVIEIEVMSYKKIEKFNSHDPKNFRKVNAWVFDLDNTLYQVTQKLLKNIDEHMGAFVANYLNTSREEAHKIQKTYFQKCFK